MKSVILTHVNAQFVYCSWIINIKVESREFTRDLYVGHCGLSGSSYSWYIPFPRADHDVWGDHIGPGTAKEGWLARSHHWRGSSTEEPQLQVAARTVMLWCGLYQFTPPIHIRDYLSAAPIQGSWIQSPLQTALFLWEPELLNMAGLTCQARL